MSAWRSDSFFFFSSRRRHTRFKCDWSSDVCSSDLGMMQAEKVAEDLREAQTVVSGSGSPVPALAAAVRRLERRHAQAPGFIEPAVKALDAALTALDEASHHIDRALATAAFGPPRLERIEERLFARPAAGRK